MATITDHVLDQNPWRDTNFIGYAKRLVKKLERKRNPSQQDIQDRLFLESRIEEEYGKPCKPLSNWVQVIFEKHGYNLEEDNAIAELCDEIYNKSKEL